MKKIKSIFIICMILGVTAFTCEKNPIITNPCSETYKIVESINDASGSIGFDKTINQYYINKYVIGTIDEVYILFPCELSDEFKKENLKVIFSGDLFQSADLPKPSLGGQIISHINIKKIAVVITNE